MATETAKKPRRPRRNFAEERAKVIQFCRMAIQIYTPLSANDSEYLGRIHGYEDVLRQMGETV